MIFTKSTFSLKNAILARFLLPFGRPEALLELPGPPFSLSWALWGVYWAFLNPPETLLEPLWEALGTILGTPGPLKGSPDTGERHFRRSWARFSSFYYSFPMRRASHDSSIPKRGGMCAALGI